jgi:hypothetical protein
MTLRISAVPLVLLFWSVSIPGLAETSKPEEKVVHLCAATPMNLSKRIVDTKWARNMLLRELKFLRKEKHSAVVIESIGIDAQQREDALAEAQDNSCDYIVLTTVMDPVGPGRFGTTVGATGIEQRPQVIGNGDPNQLLAMKFSLLRPGSPRPLAEGVSTAPAAGNDDTGASTDAMRSVAARIAGEIRKPRVQAPD